MTLVSKVTLLPAFSEPRKFPACLEAVGLVAELEGMCG